MFNLYFIGRIAFYEARLLVRSWGFRIFSGLGLVVLALVNIAVATPAFYSPHFLSSLSGSIPLNSLKLFNIFQGIVVAFTATEFFKRDRRHDSVQVVLARSFTNVDYYLGKALGILAVFVLLNLAVTAVTLIIHLFFSSTPFALQPYLLYTLLVCLPTLIFMIGLSFFLSSLVRSQVVVFIILLAYSFLALVFLGAPLFGLFDSYAFYLPLMYSDFVGLCNSPSILPLRLFYLFLGLSFVFVSPLLFKRLRQSVVSNVVTGSLSVVCLVLAVIMGFSHVNVRHADRAFRQQLRSSNRAVADTPVMTVFDYAIRLEHRGETISAGVDMKMRNESSAPLDSLLLTLNPGLEVRSVSWEDGPLNFRQDLHLLHITPVSPVQPGESVDLSVAYSGRVDERYCFLDIDDVRYESRYRLWIYDIPKRYALVTPDYVHLTPESGWYPIAGLSTAKAFPSAAAPQYAAYSLTVLCPEGLMAVSQGTSETQTLDDRIQYTFSSEAELPQISLTIGPYEHREVTVDDVSYSLYSHPGHDYFTPHLKDIGDALPDLILDLKNEYEVSLGLDYPYSRLSLVEVPIHIYSYQRLWTTAFETVQPQLVFLPEMGTICVNADFPAQARNWEKWGKYGKGKGNVTPSQVQSYFFNNFIRTNLLDGETEPIGYIKGEGVVVTFEAEIEPRFEIFPNYISYTSHLSSPEWPVLNHVVESYIRERYASPLKMNRRGGQGLSGEEEINLHLKERSLAEMMEDSNLEASLVHGALQAKGRMLLALLEAGSEDVNFKDQLTNYFERNRFRTVSQKEFVDFLSIEEGVDLKEIIAPWYSTSEIPAYLFGEVESYDVVDRERTWTQIRFKAANPTSVDGVVRIDLRYREKNRNAAAQSGYSKALLIPAETTLDIGISVDQPPALMTVDTYVSRNIPASHNLVFLERRAEREEGRFDEETAKPYDPADFFSIDEHIVDNEDEGFQILSTDKESWLSRALQKLFGKSGGESSFTGMNVYNPPVSWKLSPNPEFYGRFVRSAYLKKSGDGEDKAAWNVELDEAGSYDVYFFFGRSVGMQKMRMEASARKGADSKSGPRGRFNLGPGKKYFLVSNRFGVEEVVIDLENAEEGWNLIGTFELDAGPNRIEQTDRSDVGYVLADAVKWVKK